MTLQSTIAKLLATPDKLSSKQCAAEIEKIGKRLEKIRARDADICDATNTAGKIIGKTRRQVSETGSPEQLIALDDEVRLLGAEDQSLCFQRNSLRERVKKAVIEESPALVKAAIRRLAPALKKGEATKKAHAGAVAALEEIKNEITQPRRIATDANIKCSAVKENDFARLAALLGWDYIKPPFIAETNVRNARADRRAELTGWFPEQPVEPEAPWERVQRMRQAEARRKKESYLAEPRQPAV